MLLILLISIGIGLVTSFAYKFFVDQEELRHLKERASKLGERLKRAQKSGNQRKLQKLMKQQMKFTKQLFGKQIKPMLLTFLIIIPIFLLLGSIYGATFISLTPSGANQWKGKISGKSLRVSNQTKKIIVEIEGEKLTKGALQAGGKSYRIGGLKAKDERIQLKLNPVIVWLPFKLPFIGNDLGWLGWYILAVFLFSQFFRKLLGVV